MPGSRPFVVGVVVSLSVMSVVAGGQAQAAGPSRSSSPSSHERAKKPVGEAVEQRQRPGAAEAGEVAGFHQMASARRQKAFLTASWGSAFAQDGKQEVLQALLASGPGAVVEVVVLRIDTEEQDPAPVRYTVTNRRGMFQVTDEQGRSVARGLPGEEGFDRWYLALFPEVSWAHKPGTGTPVSLREMLPANTDVVAAPAEAGNSALAAVVRERQAHGLALGFLTEPSREQLESAYGATFTAVHVWQLARKLAEGEQSDTGHEGVRGMVRVTRDGGGADYLTVAVRDGQVSFFDARYQPVDPFLLQRFPLEYLPTPAVTRLSFRRVLFPAYLPAETWTVMSAGQARDLLVDAPVGYNAEAIVHRVFDPAPAPFRLIKTGPDKFLIFRTERDEIVARPMTASAVGGILTDQQQHLFFKHKQVHGDVLTAPAPESWTIAHSPEQAARMVLDSVHSPDKAATYDLIRKNRGAEEYEVFEVVGWAHGEIGLTLKEAVTGKVRRRFSLSSDRYLSDHLPSDLLEGPVHIFRGKDLPADLRTT